MQKFKDKINLKEKIKRGERIILELGCGKRKREGRVNIDILDLPEVDIVTDLEQGLQFVPDNCIDEINSKSFFEHVANFGFLMKEMHRVLKPNGEINIFVPHFSNPYYYSDYTHKRFFGLYTFYYFSKNQNKIKRKVPNFYVNCDFEVISQELYFISVFPMIRTLKKYIGKIINMNTLFQEIYEGHLTNIFSCYGIDVKLRAIK